MTLETSLIDSALRNWRSNVDRAGKLFGNLSQEQLLQEVAPGKNRLTYQWGHLIAFIKFLPRWTLRRQMTRGGTLTSRREVVVVSGMIAAAATAVCGGQAMTAPSSPPQPRHAAVTVLDVSDGRIVRTRDGRLEVNTKELRATIRGTTGRSIAVHFTYLGPTREISRLANGEVRHQFVLAPRAKDICNMVYVGWHFLAPDPADTIVVQVKSNPGKRTHEACLDNGYQTVTSFAAPPVRVNQEHTFTASIDGQILTVTMDGTATHVVLPDLALAFDGPDSLRSDNAHVIFTYEAQ